MNPFLIRTLSALVAVGIAVGSFALFGTHGLAVFVLLCTVVCIYEYTKHFLPGVLPQGRTLFFLTCILSVLGHSYLEPKGLLVFLFATQVAGQLWLHRKSDLQQVGTTLLRSTFGLIYVGFIPSLIIHILNMPNGLLWFFSLLLMVFSCDTMAYIVGMKIGKNKLLPTISPKKTIEGSIGGVIGALIAALATLTGLLETPWFLAMAIGFFVAIMAQAGDLVESLLKRIAQIKDSGSIMPGHGGLLDRFDGVFFAAPALYYLSSYLA